MGFKDVRVAMKDDVAALRRAEAIEFGGKVAKALVQGFTLGGTVGGGFLAKGDVAGHEFHGNQYTDGSGEAHADKAARMTAAADRASNEAIAADKNHKLMVEVLNDSTQSVHAAAMHDKAAEAHIAASDAAAKAGDHQGSNMHDRWASKHQGSAKYLRGQ